MSLLVISTLTQDIFLTRTGTKDLSMTLILLQTKFEAIPSKMWKEMHFSWGSCVAANFRLLLQ